MIRPMEPYKQTTSQSCLPVCLMLSNGMSPTPRLERDILLEGVEELEGGYAIGVIRAFQKRFAVGIEVFVDNAYFCTFLNEHYSSDKLTFTHQKITGSFLDKCSYPVIVYMDTHQLGFYDHSPHFISIESQTPTSFVILEPAVGKRIRISRKKLEESIKSLRNRLRYCPLVIKVGNL